MMNIIFILAIALYGLPNMVFGKHNADFACGLFVVIISVLGLSYL